MLKSLSLQGILLCSCTSILSGQKVALSLRKAIPCPCAHFCFLASVLPLPWADTKICGAPGGLNCGTDVTETIANAMTKNSLLNFNPAVSWF